MTPRLVGAGVICWSVDRSGDPCLLLGRERETPGWTQSKRWAGFSGRSNGDESPASCAAREFVEESMGAVPISTVACAVSVAAVGESLRSSSGRRYEHLVKARGCFFRHVTFIQRIPWGAWDERFSLFRTHLLRLDNLARDHQKACESLKALPKLFLPGYKFSSVLTVTGVDMENDGVYLLVWDSVASEVMRQKYILEGLARTELERVWATWSGVTEELHSTPSEFLEHSALEKQWAGSTLVGICVNQAYLEKSELRWWPLRNLLSIADTSREDPARYLFRSRFLDALPAFARCMSESETLDKWR